MNVLDIKNPSEIKKLPPAKIIQLAKDIREFLVLSLSKTGGHLSSNLGVVELTIALHYKFNSPKDKIIFDVGHQCYVHKILTGRAKDFETLRKYKGLSGFIKRSESAHDVWEAGHAGTSISAATGFALARDIDGRKNHVIAVIGDGSLTNGMSFEALNHIIELNQRVIIIINDNEKSISNNIGAISKLLSSVESKITSIRRGTKINNQSFTTVSNRLKNTAATFYNAKGTTRSFFSAMGYKYFGTVNGHSFKELMRVLDEAKKENGPVIIHVKTKKGKGYEYAEKCLIGRWHGVGQFDPKTGNMPVSSGTTYSKFFTSAMLEEMKEDKDIVVITPAMLKGSELETIEEYFPNRIFDVGIAEEHAVTMAAGLALDGKKPIVPIYSTFLQRSYDQMLHDVARQNIPVIFGVDRSGITGPDGDTHQGLFDVNFVRHIPNMNIAMGKDATELRALLKCALEVKKPFVLRYPKDNIDEKVKDYEVKYKTWEVLHSGTKGVIISYGPNVLKILKIVQENNIDVSVINARFIKPIDNVLFEKILNLKTKILVIEEGIIAGGFGSYLLEIASTYESQSKIFLHGINDAFVDHGTIAELKKEFKLDDNSLIEKINEVFNFDK